MIKINSQILIVLIGLSTLVSCLDRYDKSNHKSSTKVIDGYYLESYSVFSQGAYGSDVYTKYLTDSLTFRLYIDTYSPGEDFISYSVENDTIVLSKYQRVKRGANTLIYTKKYTVEELKQINRFE